MLIDMFLNDIDIIITEQRYERSLVKRELPPLVPFFLSKSAPLNAYSSFITRPALPPPGIVFRHHLIKKVLQETSSWDIIIKDS